MKRDPALVTLSHDHHQALAVALQLRRVTAATAHQARDAFLAFWDPEGRMHFRAEEEILFPAFARCGPADHPLIAEALCDHVAIRRLAADLAAIDGVDEALLAELGERLNRHVRLEERQLFALIEARLPADELAAVGAALEAAHGERRC